MIVNKSVKALIIFVICGIYLSIVLISVIYFRTYTFKSSTDSNRTVQHPRYHFAIVFRDLNENYIRELKQGAGDSTVGTNILIQYID